MRGNYSIQGVLSRGAARAGGGAKETDPKNKQSVIAKLHTLSHEKYVFAIRPLASFIFFNSSLLNIQLKAYPLFIL